jgi:hypothetical protein
VRCANDKNILLPRAAVPGNSHMMRLDVSVSPISTGGLKCYVRQGQLLKKQGWKCRK